MTQEEKILLFKDLCARLPYHVRVKVWLEYGYTEEGPLDLQHNYGDVLLDAFYYNKITKIKPYLRPMSSMGEEEKKEFIHYAEYEVEESVDGRHYKYYLKDYVGTPENPTCNYKAIDWLNAHYFDYRGLIEKGLALEAPEGMYSKEDMTKV